MAIDPTAVDDVKVPSPEFMDNYDTGGDFTPPPQVKEFGPNGKSKFVQFTLLAPSADKIKTRDENGKLLKTATGFMKAVIEGIKVTESGYFVGQTHIGTAQYNKFKDGKATGEKRNASPAIDYFHAHGIDAKPASAEEYVSLFEATADRQFLATLDWSAYDKDAGQDVASKWDDFPLASNGTAEEQEAFQRWYPGVDLDKGRLPYIEKNGKRFWARASVKRYISSL